MSLETVIPDTEITDTGLVASVVTDHDGDPDTDSSVTAATANNVDTVYHVGFATPSEPPTVGADLQEFRVGSVEFDSGQTGIPSITISLYENGALIRSGTPTNIEAYAVTSFTWNASELATSDGSLVECHVLGSRATGAPGRRNSLNIGQIEWNADVTAPPAVTVKQLSLLGVG